MLGASSIRLFSVINTGRTHTRTHRERKDDPHSRESFKCVEHVSISMNWILNNK